MGRTQLSAKRSLEIRRTNIGRVIIFCEGDTEKYYFDYFAKIIKKNKFTAVEIVLETANGNAQTVLNLANNYMNDEEKNRKFSTYGKYLAFDCDDPPNIQAVIQASKKYELLITNFLFETWLLMHFEDIESKLSKKETFRRLSKHLRSEYLKGNEGIIREIVRNGTIEKAIDNAKALAHKYHSDDESVFANIKRMNPYTSVHSLIEQFMVEISP